LRRRGNFQLPGSGEGDGATGPRTTEAELADADSASSGDGGELRASRLGSVAVEGLRSDRGSLRALVGRSCDHSGAVEEEVAARAGASLGSLQADQLAPDPDPGRAARREALARSGAFPLPRRKGGVDPRPGDHGPPADG